MISIVYYFCAASDNGYGVRLDQRNLRTPLRKVFSVPTKSLALAVAQEWQSQGSVIQAPLMHLVSTCTCINSNNNSMVLQEYTVEPPL